MIISPEGEILDICDISAEALECEDIKSSTYSECALDYDFLAETIEEVWEWED